MNWQLFYFFNQEFLDMMLLGLLYTTMFGGLILVIKLLLENMNMENNND
jgi:hypothetical protein